MEHVGVTSYLWWVIFCICKRHIGSSHDHKSNHSGYKGEASRRGQGVQLCLRNARASCPWNRSLHTSGFMRIMSIMSTAMRGETSVPKLSSEIAVDHAISVICSIILVVTHRKLHKLCQLRTVGEHEQQSSSRGR